MKKRCLLLFAAALSLSFCGNPLNIEKSNPSFLVGKWVAKRAASPIADTVLIFKQSGNYHYSISKKIDSVSRDTAYWEYGSWSVDYLDMNHDQQPNDKDKIFLFTNAESASKKENINRATYAQYNYSQSGGKEFLEILADSNIVLTTFEKDTTN